MYKIQEFTGNDAKKYATSSPPLGMLLPQEMVEKVEKVEIWGTNFSDPGPDFTDHRAFDKSGKQITNYIVSGY
tara:strand:+ start:336 stop:554 length:219 start_codon:yes stop_codon:yes gene_type:complete